MAYEKWTKDDKENIIAYPHCGHELMTYGDMAILMRIEFLRPPNQTEKQSGQIQLVLSSEGAKLLLQDLKKAIEIVDRPPTTPAN
jgi:hypothetical protein